MSRLAEVHSPASSSTAATPILPQQSNGSFHIFSATSPTANFSRTTSTSDPAPTPAPSTAVTETDNANPNESSVGEGSGQANVPEKPRVTVNVDAIVNDARRRGVEKGRRAEEVEIMSQTAARIAARLAEDHKAVLQPDVDTPFADAEDVVRRLLPYHVFHHPAEDQQSVTRPHNKGKRKATEHDLLREEIAETKFAIEAWKRRRKLEKRFRLARISTGKRPAPDDQTYALAHAVLDSERSEMTALQAEYRSAKAELDRIEREKKAAAAAAARPSPAPSSSTHKQAPPVASTRATTPVAVSTSQPISQQSTYRSQYRTYTYPYQTPFQQYSYNTYSNNTISKPSTSTTAAAPSASTTVYESPSSVYSQPHPSLSAPMAASPTTTSVPTAMSAGNLSVPSAPIPVQLPVASLSSLAAMGIIPVPAANAPPSDQPQPAAVLKGTTQNGTMVSLEINVSALAGNQATGLAVLLSTLTSRNAVGTSGSPAADGGQPSSASAFVPNGTRS